jgi:Family of unknown function (DUF6603)
MAEPGTFEKILGAVGEALLPLGSALRSPQRFSALLLALGWEADTMPVPPQSLGAAVDALYDDLSRLLGSGLNVDGSVRGKPVQGTEFSADDVARAGQAIARVIAGIRDLATAPGLPGGFAAAFPRQLLDYLAVNYLRRYQPTIMFLLSTLGVVRSTYQPGAGGRPPYVHYSLNLADLPALLADPATVLKTAFGWGQADFDYAALASQVDNLLCARGLDVLIETVPTGTALAIEGGPNQPGDPRRTALAAVFFERRRPNDSRLAAELRFLPLPAQGNLLPGFAILPAYTGQLDASYPLAKDLAVRVRSDLDLPGGVALLIRPGQPVSILAGFDTPGVPGTVTGSIAVSVERDPGDGEPTVVIGAPDSTRLQYRKFGGAAGVRLDGAGSPDVFVELALTGLEFVLDAGESDGFIGKVLPAGGFRVGADLTVGVSHRDGFYFRGTSSLEIAVPIHERVGPVDIESLTISANPKDGALPIGLGATFTAALGPLVAVVDDIGLRVILALAAEHDGNLGPVDLELGFKPPKGVGLSLDAGVVSGGGYLSIDPDRGEYAGLLELDLAGIVTIKAIGIITTKLPDGTKGFSLLVIISVEFGSPIQLGFGFTLLAVGGLLGLNRTTNLQALMDGVRTGSIESVMFPQNIVANAPKIISDLRALFPAKQGTFLIGPMAKLGWGTPTLVRVSLGIIVEVPGATTVVLGVLKVALPSESTPLILLQVNFIGAFEPDKKRVYFFATLFDSRVLFITLDGELGLLIGWGEDANFVVSVGGFHPRFSPPPLPFPSPRRLSIHLLNTSVARIEVSGYFAVTANTVQFGARAEVFFGFDVLNVQGHVGFDALFQFSPFYFVIEFSASFSVNVFGFGLYSIGISGCLEGPNPWHVKGHGSFPILFWDVDVPIDVTWGDSRDTQLPPIAVVPILQAELGKADNWRAVPPSTTQRLVTLRALDEQEAALVLHPNGVLRFSQRALPLEITLDQVGNQKPSDANRFALAVTGGSLAKRGDATELFAPAQFQSFADAERLSRPAFTVQQSGLELSASGADLRCGRLVKRVVRYEEIILDTNFKRFKAPYKPFNLALFQLFLGGAAVARCAVSQAVANQLAPFSDKITIGADEYTVAYQATNRAYTPESAGFASEASAREYLNKTVAADPTLAGVLHVLPACESVP